MPGKRLVTVEEAILLHLFEKRRHFEDEPMPMELTQAGISLALGIRRSHIASSLETAKEKELLDFRLAHIQDEKRRRKSYFLMDEGELRVRELRKSIMSIDFKIELANGETTTMAYGDLVKEYDDISIPRLAVNTYDGLVLQNVLSSFTREIYGFSGSKVDIFFGREEELAAFKDFLTSDSDILLVRGIPGIGKTTLISHGLDMNSETGSVFWFDIEQWSSQRNLLSHLADYLSGRGFERPKRYLEVNENIDLADIRDILAGADLDLIMVFDDLQNSSGDIVQMLNMLLSLGRDRGNVKLILAARWVPDSLQLSQYQSSSRMTEMEIRGLGQQASLDMLGNRGFSRDEGSAIFERSNGHPFYLAFAGKALDHEASEDLIAFLGEEIASTLSDDERTALQRLSVHRGPVLNDAVILTHEDHNAFNRLISRSLVQASEILGEWKMHSLIKDMFYDGQPLSDREKNHELAAEYHNRYSKSPASMIEEAYHLLKAGDYETALLLLRSEGQKLLKMGYQDDIIPLCEMVPRNWDDQEGHFTMLVLQASALNQKGDWPMAEKLFFESLRIADSLEIPEFRAKSLCHLAKLQYRRGELESSLGTFEDARKLVAGPSAPPSILLAEIENGIGVVNWRMGNYDRAREAYETDLALSTELRNRAGIARALNNLGILDWLEKLPDEALEKHFRAIELAGQILDKKLVAIINSNIADCYKSKDDISEAKRYYERCLELSEDLGFKWQLAEVYRSLSDIAPERREEYLDKALRIFDRLGAKEDVKLVKMMIDNDG